MIHACKDPILSYEIRYSKATLYISLYKLFLAKRHRDRDSFFKI